MAAIEFDAQVIDDTIKIPAVYEGEVKGHVHVIVFPSPSSGTPTKIDELLANPLQVDGFRPLTRDEAHGRR